MALGVLGRLRPRIISTFDSTRVAGRQPYTPAAFTPQEIPDTHFQRLSRTQGTWFCWKEPRKKSPVTPPGIYPGTVWLVAQRLNHYATLGPRLWDNVGKYCRILQDTDDNIAHAHCMPDSQVYKQTLRICITYRFSTATMAARTRLNFSRLITYIYIYMSYRTVNRQMFHFIYLFNKYTYWIF